MQKVDSRKIALITLFILILIVLALFVGKFTFSYLGADIGDDVVSQGEITTAGDTLIFSKGNNLSLNASTDNFNGTSGNLTDTTNPSVKLVAKAGTSGANATYNSGILINENTYTYSTTEKTAELILTVRDETGAIVSSTSSGLDYVTVNGISGFDITGKVGLFDIVSDKQISTTSSTTGTTHKWTYTLTFINLSNIDQSINENAKIDAVVSVAQSKVSYALMCNDDKSFACEIIKKASDGSNGLYVHNSLLERGANDNSIRYSGTNPNNWVCFGTDVEDCDDEHLYRIIGVFNNKNVETGKKEQRIKLIKAYEGTAESLGTASNGTADRIDSYYNGKLSSSPGYYWSGSTSIDTSLWTQSALNSDVLNGTFINAFEELWKNKIALSEWNVGGNIYNNITRVTPNVSYKNEIVNSNPGRYGNDIKIITTKIGLMYVSDYGFAYLPEYWSNNLNTGYAYNISRDYNWLYLGIIEWCISRNAEYNNHVFRIHSYGIVDDYTVKGYLAAVRPTFYLNSDVKLAGGSGTETDPYRIA